MKKHFEKDYNRLVKEKLSVDNRKDAMEQSIGGNFHHFGILQRELLLQQGLRDDNSNFSLSTGKY
ncbi:hypothetical protein [methanotrophic endosymbiont of Bathymodiolus puteoserpentis (Logatchev)]|uniref:hypothetical protein n=1 Tax=methanotrophic endosymbiont of Bathymodiolus puteoserpentis (Logatchev) TaxID=343235 RepID=UPI00157A2642|nr:hypothetical protein [methanotrophic endosymbiont of Bathymodiolus puteoserpentis (Logatchev)]